MNVTFETATGRVAGTHDWLTPPELLAKLGEFDLDPCASEHQPWRTAATEYTRRDDGLSKQWKGRVWCNPPYGEFAAEWIRRCAEHGNAVVFIFARTETKAFQEQVWPHADGILFLKGRVRFCTPDGKASGPAGAPSVLVAYGSNNADCLERCPIPGAFVRLKPREGSLPDRANPARDESPKAIEPDPKGRARGEQP